MRVLWIYNMPLIPEAGGTERITSLIAKGLSSQGHECLGMLVCKEDGSISYNDKPILDLYQFLEKNKIDIVINQIAYATWLLDLFLEKGGLRWKNNGGIIISCLHFDPRPASNLHYWKSLTRKNSRSKINLLKAYLTHPFDKKKRYELQRDIYNRIYNNSNAFVTLSKAHFPALKSIMRRGDYDKLYAINNPLTFDKICDAEVLDSKERIILVCARMDEYQKRLSLVLRAWQKIQNAPKATDWKLIFIGTGPDLDYYKELASSLNLSRVYFEGRQKPENYYLKSSIFAMTSCFIEGWGLTITESLQRGVVPVVMDSNPVFHDMIKNGYNGYLTKDSDIKSYADKLYELMSDPKLLNNMQKNALESASQFKLDSVMIKWQQLIENILINTE